MNDLLVKWTRLLAIFTGLLFLITVVIACLSYKQTEDSRAALLISRRAFVNLASIEGMIIGENFIVRPRWENSGTTPTKWARESTLLGLDLV